MSSPLQVWIGTTEGVSVVQRLSREDPEVRSVVCLNGTSEALPISAAYDAFVRKPTGIIERTFRHPVFRLDVSDPIDGGASWQLGTYLAHFLNERRELARPGGQVGRVVWATGGVNSDLDVLAVEHVAIKLRHLARRMRELGIAEVTAFIPQDNYQSDGKALLGEIVGTGIDLTGVSHFDEVLSTLGLGHGAGQLLQPGGRATRRRQGANPWLLGALGLSVAAAGGYFGYRHYGSVGTPVEPPLVAPAPVPDTSPQAPKAKSEESKPAAPRIAKKPAPSSTEPPKTVVPSPRPPTMAEPGSSDAPTKESVAGKEPPAAAAVRPGVVYADPVRAPFEPPAVAPLRVALYELRPPRGSNCAAVVFGQAKPRTVPASSAAEHDYRSGRGEDLCGIELRLSGEGARDIDPRDMARSLGRQLGQPLHAEPQASDSPGDYNWRVNLPRRVRRSVRYSFTVSAGPDQRITVHHSITR